MTCFTICSNNYIYKALVLAASVKKLDKTPVLLFLADEPEEGIDYPSLIFDRVVLLDELGIPNLQWMKEHYSIVELNTAIKPFAFKYLLKHTAHDSLYYFDPDIRVYQPVSAFERFWAGSSILLTPHILTPIPLDGKFPAENLFLNHGTFNLGFLGLKRSEQADHLLSWWSERMLERCTINLVEGYFVDQIWFNLVPGFFHPVTVTDHPGWNMSYWNLHERTLSHDNDGYLVNGNKPLFFFHFSSFDPRLVQIHYKPDFRYRFEDNETLKTLYREYLVELNGNNPDFYKGFAYFKGRFPLPAPRPSLGQRVIRKIRALMH
jgi:hypothetical protein